MHACACMSFGCVGKLKAERWSPPKLVQFENKGRIWDRGNIEPLPFFLFNNLSSKETLSFVWGIHLLWYHLCPIFCSHILSLPVFGGPDVFVSRPILVMGVCREIIMSQRCLLWLHTFYIQVRQVTSSLIFFPYLNTISPDALLGMFLQNLMFFKGIKWRTCMFSFNLKTL